MRGVGARTLGALVGSARAREVAPGDLLADPERVDGLGPAHRAALSELGDALEAVRGAVGRGIEAACAAAEEASGWRAELAGAREPDERRRPERLAVLREIARRAEAEGRGLEEFLGLVALGPEEGSRAEALAIATVHAAKGLEWSCVWVCGAVEGELPHHRALRGGDVTEERRVAYVALTRAMDELVVSAPRRIRGREGPCQVSRFVAEAGLVSPAARAA